MSKRQRMTWAALDREAAAPPAIPGYGVEDQDHPAHTQDDPGSAPYRIGGPPEFAEDVHQPPYGDSGPPATPGYGVEDQDHPAHQGQVGRQASLMELVRRKSAKALVLAKATLGKKASWDAIEDQAFGFMSMDDKALDASIGRLGGDFLGMEEELMGMFPEEMVEEEGIVEDDMDDLDPIMARMKAMEDELTAMRAAARRRADQNAPSGPTLGASGQSAEEEKRDEQAISNQNDKAASNPVLAMFDAFDTDRDGFVTAEDWTGPRAMFASMDTDRDGIIARHEVLAALPPEFLENAKKKKDEAKKDDKGKEAAKKADDDEDEDDEVAAAKKAYVAALRRAAKKAEGEDEETASDDEDEDDKGKEASKVAFGHMAEFDDDELEMLQAMQYGMDDDEGETACGDVTASDDSDEDDEEGSDKEAADHDEPDEDDEGGPSDDDEDDEDDEGGDKEASDAEFFQTGFDPMGLSDGTELTAADEAAFKTVFGSEDDDADDEGGDSDPEEDEDEGEKAGKKANQKLASLLKPQARKPSQGVQRVGTQSRTASAGRNEVNELSKLWASDPDVSGSFS